MLVIMREVMFTKHTLWMPMNTTIRISLLGTLARSDAPIIVSLKMQPTMMMAINALPNIMPSFFGLRT